MNDIPEDQKPTAPDFLATRDDGNASDVVPHTRTDTAVPEHKPRTQSLAATTTGTATGLAAAGQAAGAGQVAQTLGATASVASSVAQSPSGAPDAVLGTVESSASSVPAVAQAASVARKVQTLASDVASLITPGGKPIERVRYEFAVTQGPAIAFHVRKVVQFAEELGEPYALVLDLVTDDVNAPTDELLGASGELFIDRGDLSRAVYGIIDRVEDRGVVQQRLAVQVRVVPAFKLLEHESDTRIFQGRDVKEILTEILEASLTPYEREFDAETHLKGAYNKRDYCTQFRETNLDFACRLMEEEGITFFFAPDGDGRKEKLVLIDNNADYGDVPLVVGDEIPIVPDRAEQAENESIQTLAWARGRTPNKIATRGYNLKVPQGLDTAETEAPDEHNPTVRELYLHDERRQIIDDPIDDPAAAGSFTGEGLDQREPMAQIVSEQWRAKTKVLVGRSNVTGFRPGLVFRLGEHTRRDIDGQRFLLTKVEHTGDVPQAEIGAERAGELYENRFWCIPVEHEFRPEPRRKAPRVHGIQTARVVGPPGEEIHTDPLGRIRAWFHWDRREPDDTSSCWIPVMQAWGGPQWGFVFIPRVGMEVVVQFLDGNPDRPIVTGSIYNGDNKPPYTLPNEKTKSVIKTSSSPGNGGYNELTFEDAAGAEQIIVHAQKDFNETVENDHNTTVHHNQTIGVDADQSTSVGGNQSNTVKKNQTETVTGNVTITVEGERSHTITKKETVTLEDALSLTVGATEFHQVTAKLTEVFDAGRETTITQGDTEIVATGDKVVDVSSGALTATAATKIALAQAGSHAFVLENRADLFTTSDFALTNGQVTIESKGGVLELTAATEISLVCGAASIKLTSDGSIDIQGAKKAVMGTPGSTLSAEPSGVSLSGAKLSSTAIGVHEIKGALIKLN